MTSLDPTARKEAPETLALRARPRAVVRLSRRALVLVGGVSALVLGAAAIWALGHHHGPSAPVRELYSTDRKPIAEGLATLPHDYSALPKPTESQTATAPAVPQLGPPLPGDLGRPILRAEQQNGVAPTQASPEPSPEVQARVTERQRVGQERDQALHAQLFVQTSQRQQTSAATANTSDVVAGSTSTNPFAPPATPSDNIHADEAQAQNGQDRKAAFLGAAADTKVMSTQRLQTPTSPYQLMAGTLLSAAMVTGLNSDLPGECIATITEPVYDTMTGRTLLIPQGSRLLGQYDSQVTYGQSRVLLVWNRIVMPDGSSIVLDRLPATDPQGYAGVQDGVDNHWGKLLAGAALSTLLGVGAELGSQNDGLSGTGQQTVVVATSRSAEDSLNQVGQQITRRNLNVQPTLTVRPGFPVRVIVNKDLVLRPYRTAVATRSEGQAP